MDIKRIHFIREILVTDHLDNPIPAMQFSYDNASYLKPTFQLAPTEDQAQVRELYRRLGGSRPEGEWSGSTVIIPNRSFWASLWGISADEVQVMPGRG